MDNLSLIIKSDESLSSLSYLSKRLDEYEKLAIVNCYKIKDENNFLLMDSTYKSSCSHISISSIFEVKRDLETLSGTSIEISFRYIPPFLTMWIFEIISLFFSIGFYLFLKELSQKKQREEQERMEYSRQIVQFKKLSEQILHDAKSPLSVLTLLSKAPGASDNMKELLSLASHRILSVLSDLKEYREKELFDAVSSVRTVVNEMEKTHQVSIKLECPDEKISLNLNRGHFERVIANLINNAVDSGGSGQIKISVQIEIENILIAIEDKGVGIPIEVQKKIGIESVTFGKLHGQGLGLSDAYQKVKSWNGEIWFTSQINNGTSFFIRLPK